MTIINSTDPMVNQCRMPVVFANATANGNSAYVKTSLYTRITAMLSFKNATTVTGAAITFSQATDVAGSGSKALAFTTYYENIDTDAGDWLEAKTAAGNTFTTDTTNSKSLLYVVEFQASDLDTGSNFNCMRVNAASGANVDMTAIFILWPPLTANQLASTLVD